MDSLFRSVVQFFKFSKANVAEQTDLKEEAGPAGPPAGISTAAPPPYPSAQHLPPQNRAQFVPGHFQQPPYPAGQRPPIPSNHIQFGNGAPPQNPGQTGSTQRPPHPNQPPSPPASNSRDCVGPYGACVCLKANKLPPGTNGQNIIKPDSEIFAIWLDELTAIRYRVNDRPPAQAYEADSLVEHGVTLKRAIGSDNTQKEFLSDLERVVIEPARLVVAQQIKHKKAGLILLRGDQRLFVTEEICRLECCLLLGRRVRLTNHTGPVDKTYVGTFDDMEDDDMFWVDDVPYHFSDNDLARKLWTMTAYNEKQTAA